VFIGFMNPAASGWPVNVLAGFLSKACSRPCRWVIGQVRLDQLGGIYDREHHPKQST